MDDDDESSSSSFSESSDSASSSRQVQFGAVKKTASSESEDEDTKSVESFDSDTVNERLRHEAPQKEPIVETKNLSRVMAGICTAVLQDTLQKIVIIRELNNMSKLDVELEYVPFTEKYKTAEHDIDFLINSSEEFLTFKKLNMDLSWLEKVLDATLVDMQRTFYCENLIKILNDDRLNKEEEKQLLDAKEFNRRELKKLRIFMDDERRELTTEVQNITEEVGNLKDQLSDNITEDNTKVNYVKQWQNSRNEQNMIILRNKESKLENTTKKMLIEIDKENRVHEEMREFLDISLGEYKNDIEKWMNKYDNDLEEKEQQVQSMQIKKENQKEQYAKLQEEYNDRQQQIDAYKAHKLQRQKEEEELERRTHAAVSIQAWWRGVMFRKGLGPFRRKKGKGKKGGSKKNSAKKKK